MKMHVLFIFLNVLIFSSCNNNLDSQKEPLISDCCGCCYLTSFVYTYSSHYNSSNVFFVMGEVLEPTHHGYKIEVVTDIKGNFNDSNYITVWGANPHNKRLDGAFLEDAWHNLQVKDTIVCFMEANSLFDINLPYEKAEDYATLTCSYSVLKYSEGYVTGKICRDISQPLKDTIVDWSFDELWIVDENTTMLWSDLLELFEIINE